MLLVASCTITAFLIDIEDNQEKQTELQEKQIELLNLMSTDLHKSSSNTVPTLQGMLTIQEHIISKLRENTAMHERIVATLEGLVRSQERVATCNERLTVGMEGLMGRMRLRQTQQPSPPPYSAHAMEVNGEAGVQGVNGESAESR